MQERIWFLRLSNKENANAGTNFKKKTRMFLFLIIYTI